MFGSEILLSPGARASAESQLSLAALPGVITTDQSAHRPGISLSASTSQSDAYVLAVGESWVVPLFPTDSTIQAEQTEAVSRADALAAQGASRVRAAFPAWTVSGSGLAGSVASVIVQRAAEVSADVIFIGSHSRSAVGLFFLGSVSQKVAGEAKCSVRICRPRRVSGTAPRIMVALDGSEASQAAVRAVAERTWPAGVSVAVVNVIDPPLRARLDELPPDDAAEIQRQHQARLDWLEAAGLAAVRQLEAAGLAAERHSLAGEPKSTLLKWAENWNADALFIGASGLHHPGAGTLGTVASALAVRARCPVEIVR